MVHCKSEDEARLVLAALAERMTQVGLELHPEKTRMVYCKDDGPPRLARVRAVHVSWATRFVPGCRRTSTGSTS